MSREIKFRAWVKSENCYMGKWLDAQHPTIFSVVNEVAEFYGDDELVIEQYTGLKDKNGKEIYEGDIVQDSKEVFCIVGWNTKEAHFGLYVGKQLELTDFIWIQGEDIEVIGNIHENKELLK